MVFGILNATPDSFYAGSRANSEAAAIARTRQIADEGGDAIDVGACSTRPGADRADEREEMARLRIALPAIAKAATGLPISIDTFRPDVARMAVEEYGASYINDISATDDMFRAAANLGKPYILMSSQPDITAMMKTFARQTDRLHELGVADIILDPGFGFGKTIEQNYDILRQLSILREFGMPVLAALSRKSMIWRPLSTTPDGALAGTIALQALALAGGADMLRAHDVREAVQTMKLYKLYSDQSD